jgi:hypothetical protein
VDRFDHHCPWINNCVGINNHNTFISYVAFQYILLLVTFGAALYSVIEPVVDSEVYKLLGFWDWQSEELYSKAAAVIVMAISGFFTVPLS